MLRTVGTIPVELHYVAREGSPVSLSILSLPRITKNFDGAYQVPIIIQRVSKAETACPEAPTNRSVGA